MPAGAVRPLLGRGMLAGVVGGVVAFVISYVFGEGPLSAGIAFEESHAVPEGMAGMPGMAGMEMGEAEPVGRAVQSTLGLGVVALLFGVAIGGLFALVYAVTQGRLGAIGPRAAAMVVAVSGFVGAYLIPQFKYPANPPGINSGDTSVPRVESYLAALLVGLVVVCLVVWLARRLAPQIGAWNAAILAIVLGAIAVGVAFAFLPAIDETPPDFPASVLWQFRVSSFAAQAAMWATLGLVFGALTERAARRELAGGAPEREAAAVTHG
jgi:pimeloyl-ACP methyl ester carboxylesterase